MNNGDTGTLRCSGCLERHLLTLEDYLAAIASDDATQDVDECRLSSTILTHQRVDLATTHIHVDII